MPEKIVEIPSGVEVSKEGDTLTVKGPKGELSRPFKTFGMKISVSGSEVKFSVDSKRRRKLAVIGTFASHLMNMIQGSQTGYEAKLKSVYSHFPMKITVEGDVVVIQNFMGERSTRRANIVGGAKVDIKKDEIIVTGNSKEDVGQTAANIELSTKVSGFDKRIFQDGCYITLKPVPVEDGKDDVKGEGK